MSARYWMVAEDRLIDGPAGVKMIDGFAVLVRVKLPGHVMGLESRSLLHVYDRDASPNYDGCLVHITVALGYGADHGRVERVSILSRQVEAGGEALIPDAWRVPPGARPEDLVWSAAAVSQPIALLPSEPRDPAADQRLRTRGSGGRRDGA